MNVRALLLTTCIACGLAAPAAAVELVTNGIFDSGNFTGWTFTADAGAEPSMTPTVAMFQGSNAFQVNAGSSDGGAERGGTLSQLIPLVSGQAYQVSANTLGIANVSGSPNAEGGTITVSLAGTILRTFNVDGIAANQVLTDSFSQQYIANATGNAALELRFTRQFPNFVSSVLHYADNISVQQVVPEPSAIGLALIGLMGASIWLRRTKAAAIAC